MIKHVVMWKFKENTEKEMDEFLEGLKSLENQIPEIKSMQVGRSLIRTKLFLLTSSKIFYVR